MNQKLNKEFPARATDDSSTKADEKQVSPAIGNTNVSSRFEILRANYWEHFKAAKDMAFYLEPSHPKRLRIEKELNYMLAVLNGC